MGQIFKKLQGTTSQEFHIGPGEVENAGDDAIAFRTNAGVAEYREAGGLWQPLVSAGGFNVDTILTDDITGQVLVDDVSGNVLVDE